jgi:hypothetical protein
MVRLINNMRFLRLYQRFRHFHPHGSIVHCRTHPDINVARILHGMH